MSLSELVAVENNVIKSLLEPRNLDVSLKKLIIQALQKGGDKTLFINAHTGRRWTYHEVLVFIRKTTNVLESEGVCEGDVVLFHIEQDDIYSLLILSATVLGAVITAAPYGCKLNGIMSKMELAGSKFAILDEATFVSLSREDTSWKLLLVSDIIKAIEHATEADISACVPTSADDNVMIGFTSGSTGEPKAIKITQKYVLGAINIYNRKFVGCFEGETNFVYCVETSFNHVLDWTYFVIMVLADSVIVLYQCHDSYKLVEYISEYEITSAQILSSKIPAILEDAAKKKLNLSSLRYIHVGGSMLPPDEVMDKFIGLFPNLKYLQSGYGLCETGFVTLQPYFVLDSDYHSSGVPLPGASYKVIDRKNGMKLGPNEIGTIHVKTIQQSAFSYMIGNQDYEDLEGYFKTEDAGYYNSEGLLFITGRYKEVISCDGYDVFPAEFETSLASHPLVREVAVIAVDHHTLGQTAKAFVVLRSQAINGDQLTEKQLVEYHNERTGVYYKELHGGITFVDQLPRTSNGKIDKKKLHVENTQC